MPVKGVSQVKANMKRVFKDIESKKAVQFVTAVVNIGASESKEYTPIEYSTLINSQIVDVTAGNNMVIGSVSFNTDYAAFLENNEKWNPRPVSAKKGPAANLAATPHFLQKGFESPQSQAAIKKAIDIFKV